MVLLLTGDVLYSLEPTYQKNRLPVSSLIPLAGTCTSAVVLFCNPALVSAPFKIRQVTTRRQSSCSGTRALELSPKEIGFPLSIAIFCQLFCSGWCFLSDPLALVYVLVLFVLMIFCVYFNYTFNVLAALVAQMRAERPGINLANKRQEPERQSNC